MQSHLRLHFNNEEASDEQVCSPMHSQLQRVQCGRRLDWHMVLTAGKTTTNSQLRRSTRQTRRETNQVVKAAGSIA